MSARPDSFMPLYTGDWLRGTARLSPNERDAYMLLIIDYWDSGKPLPNDDRILARVARVSASEWDAVKVTVKAFFKVTLEDTVEVLRHARIDKEIRRAAEEYAKRKARSDAANAAKLAKSNLKDTLEVTPEVTQPQPQPQSSKEEKTETMSADADGVPARVPKAKKAYPEAFEAFWKAYEPPKNAPKPRALKAWLRWRDLPPLETLLRCVAAYRSWLKEETRKRRGDPYPIQHPSTWLNERGWEAFLELEKANSTDARAYIAVCWNGSASEFAARIGEAAFASWFAGSVLEKGPPAVIRVQGAFTRDYIQSHFMPQLEEQFGRGVRVEIPTNGK